MSTQRTPWAFFALFVLLSAPIWVVGGLSPHFLPAWIPINLPTAALMTFNPALAALILAGRDGGWSGVSALLRRLLAGWRRPGTSAWLVAFLYMPVVMTLNYAWVIAQGRQPQPAIMEIALLPVLFVMFLVGAVGEELGWQGYAYDRLEAGWGVAPAALGLGTFWALIHVVPLFQAERVPLWIAWHCLGQVFMRVIIVWLYRHSGRSLPVVIVFHAMSNVAEYLIPNFGSSYDPVIVTGLMGLTVLVIAFAWEPMFRDAKRLLYRGGRPNAVARLLNRFWASVYAWGVAPNRYVTLEVVGRKSRRVITFPLVMVVVDGERYLVSMLGAEASWVRNVEAAGGRARLRHGRVEDIRLEPAPVEQRGQIVRQYLKVAAGARPHIAVDVDAPLEAFAAIAAGMPVFRVEPTR